MTSAPALTATLLNPTPAQAANPEPALVPSLRHSPNSVSL